MEKVSATSVAQASLPVFYLAFLPANRILIRRQRGLTVNAGRDA